MSTIKRVIFMGSPVFAVPALIAIKNAGLEVACVYSQPPRPAGRGGRLTPTPVHQAALDLGLEVRHPDRLKGEALDELLATPCDAICVVGYGLLLPKALVDSRICLNVHPSALPRWRGATPVQSAIMAGDASTDVCIMRLDVGMDTGPVYDRTAVAIAPDMTAGELNDVVWPLGASRLVHVLANLNSLTPVEQTGEATAAGKLTAEARPIQWHNHDARAIVDHIRALSPTPAATTLMAGEPVKVLRAAAIEGRGNAGEIVALGDGIDVACADGVVRLVEIQRPGKKPMAASEALRGWPELAVGLRIGGVL